MEENDGLTVLRTVEDSEVQARAAHLCIDASSGLLRLISNPSNAETCSSMEDIEGVPVADSMQSLTCWNL